MEKKKKIIIILLILIVLLALVYFLIFNKSYTLTVYKYQINNQENIGKTMPKNATLIEQYDVKCNKKCELITYDYDKTFFVVKNKKEGYIYNTLTKKAIDVGPHPYFSKFQFICFNSSISSKEKSLCLYLTLFRFIQNSP